MNHDTLAAGAVAAVLFALSIASAFAGRILATDIPPSVLLAFGLFLGGILVSVLGWIATQVYRINGTTAQTNEMVKGAVGDVTSLEGRVTSLEGRVLELERRHP